MGARTRVSADGPVLSCHMLVAIIGAALGDCGVVKTSDQAVIVVVLSVAGGCDDLCHARFVLAPVVVIFVDCRGCTVQCLSTSSAVRWAKWEGGSQGKVYGDD
eukprot:39440-Eustigmatos_ZCMA.PRE.1